MAVDLQSLARNTQQHVRKSSLASSASTSSTCGGQLSDSIDYSSDDYTLFDTKIHSGTQAFPAPYGESATSFSNVGEDDLDTDSYLDHEDLPPTREPSPEPLAKWDYASYYDFPAEYFAGQQDLQLPNNACRRGWNEEHILHAHGRQLPRESSREPATRHGNRNPLAQPYQMVIFVPEPIFVPSQGDNVMLPMSSAGALHVPLPPPPPPPPPMLHVPRGVPTVGTKTAPAQPKRAPSSTTHVAPAQEKKEGLKEGESTKEQTAAPKKSRRRNKELSAFDTMTADQKEDLCKYIYAFMLEKGFTSPDGYLIVDVFFEVWKEVGDTEEGWRVAQHRFGELLSSAPEYFRLFRRSIRVANSQCGWFARKGQKMVSLVLDGEK
jgi:hypothetical protein